MKTRVFVVMYNNRPESISEPEAIFLDWSKAEEYIPTVKSDYDEGDGVTWTIEERYIDL